MLDRKRLEAALGATLFTLFLAFAAATWHWPLVGDAPLLHYVVFLTRHGFTPYTQIIDLNLPGTLAIQAGVMRLLGEGALAWRIFDLSLLCIIGAAMLSICRPVGLLPALLAAVTFALIHGRDGLIQSGQRDLLMAAFVVTAFALALSVARGRCLGPCWLANFAAGLCLGAACTVKPDALLLPPFFVLLFSRHLRSRGLPWLSGAGVLALGTLIPLLTMLAYLGSRQALGAFFDLMRHLAPYHAAIWRQPPRTLLVGAVSSVLLTPFLLWLAVFVLGRRWTLFLDQALLLGLGFGFLSFYLQGRGYPYHRYPSEVFLLLLIAIACTEALRAPAGPVSPLRRGVAKTAAAAGLLFLLLVVLPRSLSQALHFSWRHDAFAAMLQPDLASLGGPRLSGHVQCLDMAGGCITALYNARLVQSTGYLYDCYLYPQSAQAEDHVAERDRYRSAFQAALTANPPLLFIVSSDECGPPDHLYRKLQRWPWLETYLRENYTLLAERVPTTLQNWGGKAALPYGYRLYQARHLATPMPAGLPAR